MKRLLLVALVAGCGDRATPIAQIDRDALVAKAPEHDDVVAVVDGRPVRASDVVAQAKASGSDAKRALLELVDAELLAGVAVERGLLGDADVVAARKAAEVRRLLETDFEARVTVDGVPEAEQRKAYEINKLMFDHPDAVEAWHVVASGPSSDPVAHQRAREKIVSLEPAARAAGSDQAFAALAEAPSPNVQLKAERMTFPRRGVVEDSFADAAFRLDTPGEVSPPTESSYGFHLIRLVRKLPERHAALESVRPELRAAAFPTWRKAEFERWIRALSAQWSVQVFADHLEAAGKAAHP